MLRTANTLVCLTLAGLLSGCANYDGSNFHYGSGGLPFLGMTFAVGHDKNEDDIQVLRADGSKNSYVVEREEEPILNRLPNMIRNIRAPKSIQIPAGSERVLRDDDYEKQLNQL